MKIVFLRILGMSITASFLIVALILFRAMLKKAPKAMVCALWILAAIRLVCPISIQSPFSVLPDTVEEVTAEEWIEDQAAATAGLSDLVGYLEGAAQGQRTWFNGDLPLSDLHEEDGSPAEAGSAVLAESGADSADWQSNQSSSEKGWEAIFRTVVLTRLWVPALTGIWLIGLVLMLLAAVRSFWQIWRKVSASIQTGENIWICDYIQTPFVLGMIRPRIYLPSDMSSDHFNSVTAHEKAHLQRRDHWWKPIAYLILSIHWFNPLVWVAYILFCRDIELACDERVVRSMSVAEKKAYSEALLSLSLSRRLVSAAYPLSFGEVGVKERIKTVLNNKKPALWAAALALVGSTVLAACLMTNPTPEAVEAGLNEIIAVANGVADQDPDQDEFLQQGEWAHFLLLGLDGQDEYENRRSDAVIVLSVSEEKGQVILSSIPRDTMVYISGRGFDKLAHGYVFGGAEEVMEIFRTNFDIEITGYITVNFEAMEKIVDLLGGLTLTLTDKEAEHMGEYFGAWGLEGGTQLLSGYEVLQYCRVRKIDSDYVRNDRQFTVLQTIYEEVKNLSVTKYEQLIETIYPYVSTSLTDRQCVLLAGTLLELLDGQELIHEKLVDNEHSSAEMVMGVTYILADNLIDTAVRWHEEVLGMTEYTPSQRLTEISRQLESVREG